MKNPSPNELSQALSNYKSHILHFLGHGKPGALALGDEKSDDEIPNAEKETCWLEDKSLSDFLRAGNVKLVVLQRNFRLNGEEKILEQQQETLLALSLPEELGKRSGGLREQVAEVETQEEIQVIGMEAWFDDAPLQLHL